MKFVKPSATLIQEENPFIKIERVGRLCYKSDSEYTEETGKKFFSTLTARGHTAMVEHANFLFEINERAYPYYNSFRYLNCTKAGACGSERYLVSGNLRAINEITLVGSSRKDYVNNIDPLQMELAEKVSPLLCYQDKNLSDIKRTSYHSYRVKLVSLSDYTDLTEEEILAHKYYTIHFICDRGVSMELIRHRPCSFAQESTRYCNYSKDKYGNELTFIEPFWLKESSREAQAAFYQSLEKDEDSYLRLLNNGWSPERARAVLPNVLKTEIVVTANLNEWNHIFDLRYFEKTGKAHPQMKELMDLAYPLIYPNKRS